MRTRSATIQHQRRDDSMELGSVGAKAASSAAEEPQCIGQTDDGNSVWSEGSLAYLNSDALGTDSCVDSICSDGNSGNSNKGDRCQKKRHEKLVGVDNFHFAGHLLHRVCEVTGDVPRSESSEAHESSSSPLLQDSGEEQLSRLRRNPRVMDVLERLKALSVFLLDPKYISPSEKLRSSGSPNSRRSLVRIAQEGYLKLFEEMLLELLKMQRAKSKVKILHRIGGCRGVQGRTW